MNAVVLAGGGRDDVCDGTGVANKAFVSIGGVPMVARVLGALRNTAGIERIIAVAPAVALDDPALEGAAERRASGVQILESLEAGVAGLPPDERVLIVASDAPLLDPRGVERFMAAVEARDPDLAYAIVERRAHDARFPGVRHTWARMRGGTFCGGAVFALKPSVVPALAQFLGRLAAARKQPVRLASVFGIDVLIRFALGLLSVEAAEGRASAILGVPVAAISSDAELAFNVDRKDDLVQAERYAAALISSA